MTAYVQIIVPNEFTPQQIKTWFSTVQDNVPSGLIGSTSLQQKGETRESKFFHKQTANGKHAYVIPLVRDLDASEVHSILKKWCELYSEGDFTFDYSQSEGIQHAPPPSLEQHKIDQVLDAWAKHQHQAWMKRHTEQGWRYGVKLSSRDKTHPWLQPWESLPPRARELNVHGVKDLLKILNDFGYTIVQKPQG